MNHSQPPLPVLGDLVGEDFRPPPELVDLDAPDLVEVLHVLADQLAWKDKVVQKTTESWWLTAQPLWRP